MNMKMPDVESVTTLYGRDTQKIRETGDSRIYRTEHSSGTGTVEKYDVFPGIQLYNQFFRLTCLDYDREIQRYSRDIITINHCRLGRFEAEFEDGEFLYLGEGDLAMNLPEKAPFRHSFPLNHFQGFTIIISIPEAGRGMLELERHLGQNPINLELLRDRLLKGNEFVVFRTSPEMEHIVEGMYKERTPGRLFFLRLKVLELLIFLLTSEDTAVERRPYFHRRHVISVKAMSQFLVEHLDCNFTLQELSERFDIPLTTMKKCFKAVYGMPIHSYVIDYRIQTAANLLQQTGLSIAEISEKVGYSNQSKFTESFKRRMGCTPIAYRNLKS